MIQVTALLWSVALHTSAAVLVLEGEPRSRFPLAEISLFDASPLPTMTGGSVPPIVVTPSQWASPCPASPPHGREARLTRMADASFVRPMGGCIRVDEEGRVDAIAFSAGVDDADRRYLGTVAAGLRFVPATRDEIRVAAWRGIAVRRRVGSRTPRPICDGGCR